jgi:hypothetical protein
VGRKPIIEEVRDIFDAAGLAERNPYRPMDLANANLLSFGISLGVNLVFFIGKWVGQRKGFKVLTEAASRHLKGAVQPDGSFKTTANPLDTDKDTVLEMTSLAAQTDTKAHDGESDEAPAADVYDEIRPPIKEEREETVPFGQEEIAPAQEEEKEGEIVPGNFTQELENAPVITDLETDDAAQRGGVPGALPP